jgi:hypothetical protein
MASTTEFSRNARSFETEVAPSRGVSDETPDSDTEDQDDSDYDEGMADEDDTDEEEDTDEEVDEEEDEAPAPKAKGKSGKPPTEKDLNALRSSYDKQLAEANKRAQAVEANNKMLQETVAKNYQEKAAFEKMAFEWSIANEPTDVQQQRRVAFAALQRENLKDAQIAALQLQNQNAMKAFSPMVKDKVLQMMSEETGVPVERLEKYDDPKVAEEVAKVIAEHMKESAATKRKARKADVFEGGGGGSKQQNVLAKFKGTGDIQGYLAALERQNKRRR